VILRSQLKNLKVKNEQYFHTAHAHPRRTTAIKLRVFRQCHLERSERSSSKGLACYKKERHLDLASQNLWIEQSREASGGC